MFILTNPTVIFQELNRDLKQIGKVHKNSG